VQLNDDVGPAAPWPRRDNSKLAVDAFADIKGSTELMEDIDPEEAVVSPIQSERGDFSRYPR
jgi:hypothetical protein